jgi:hypothetical protein
VAYTPPNPNPPPRPTPPQSAPIAARPTAVASGNRPAAPATAPAPTLPALKASIERACTGRGRDVDVSSRGPGKLLVKIKVRQTADAEYLAHAVSQLPELGPYQVLYEMQVGR